MRESHSNCTIVQDLIDGLISAVHLHPPQKPSFVDKYYKLYCVTKLKAGFDAYWNVLPMKKQVKSRRLAEINSWVKQSFEAELNTVKEHMAALKQWNAGVKSTNTVGG